MSGKKKTSSKSEATGETGDADFPAGLETDVETEAPETPPASQKSSGGVAWLALLVAVVAMLAVAALAFLYNRNAAGDVAASTAEMNQLTASLSATQEAVSTLEQRIGTLSSQDAERVAQIASLRNELGDRLRQLDPLPGRLASVESSIAAVQGVSIGARDAWLLAEAEYYMQIANAQLQLANNPMLASLALTQADDRLVQMADPRLTRVRQALSDELRSLELISGPDTAGITLTLASLAGTVDSLPLRQGVVVRETTSTEIDPDLSGMDRAMASLRSAIGGVVSVRRSDEAMQPLIAPEAQYFLRANLALQLQAARLALLRGEEALFRQSLDDANAWLEEYYDPANAGVQSARDTIIAIRGSVLSVAMPDISRSLRLLRQFNVQASTPVTNDAEPEQ